MAMSSADRSKRFRIKNKAALRVKARERMRAKRAAAKLTGKTAAKPLPETPSDLATAICEWAAAKLKVPPGHSKEGQPFEVPEYGEAFLRDALAETIVVRRLLVFGLARMPRSAIVAVLVLSSPCGAIAQRRLAFCGVAVTRPREGERASRAD